MAGRRKPEGKRRDTRKGRFYDFAEGRNYPSVTTILGMLGKPALIGWAAKEERKLLEIAFREKFEEMREVMGEHLGELSGEEFTEMVMDHVGSVRAHQKKLREAADIGTQVHKWIEWDIQMALLKNADDAPVEPLITHPKAEESRRKYLAWKESVRMEPLSTEMQIVSHVHRYAGTEDIRLRVWPPAGDPLWKVIPTELHHPDGVVVTGDFKTGKAVYGEMFLQNGAYRLAEMEMGIEPPSEAGIIIRLPKEENDPEFEVVPVPPMEKTVPAFLALRHGVFPWWQEEEERYEAKRAKAREQETQAA